MEKIKVTKKALKKAYKPFDIVTDFTSDVGFIREVAIEESFGKTEMIYSVEWLIKGSTPKHAWYRQEDLTSHCNLFMKIAEAACNPTGQGRGIVPHLFRAMRPEIKELIT